MLISMKLIYLVLSIRNKNIQINGPVLKEKTKHFANLLNKLNFRPGNGLLQQLKDRHDIVF